MVDPNPQHGATEQQSSSGGGTSVLLPASRSVHIMGLVEHGVG
jgi:hypothetical protein